MAFISYVIALMIGFLIAMVVVKTALFWMDKGNNE